MSKKKITEKSLDDTIDETFGTKKESHIWYGAGGVHLISEMSTAHIENCINLIARGGVRKQAFLLPVLEEELKKRKERNHKDIAQLPFEIYKQKIFTDKFIDENQEAIDWNLFSQFQELTPYIIEKYKRLMPWHLVYKFQRIPDEFIENHHKEIKWDIVILDEKYDESFFEKWFEFINLKKLVKTRKLSSYFIEKFYPFLDFKLLCRHQILSEEFIEEHEKEISWVDLSYHLDKYSIYFVEKYADKIVWAKASTCENLSLQVIQKYHDKVNWDAICQHNKLITYEFVIKNKDYFYLTNNVYSFLEKHFGSKTKRKNFIEKLRYY